VSQPTASNAVPELDEDAEDEDAKDAVEAAGSALCDVQAASTIAALATAVAPRIVRWRRERPATDVRVVPERVDTFISLRGWLLQGR